MTLLQHRSLSARLRSGLFAFVFAPIALVFLGSSMVDVQALAAVGQPLASVEGLIGLALASLLLALIALNCEESSTGMVVTFVWSIIVGATQFYGVARIPFLMRSSVEPDDMSAGVVWSLYPMCLSLMLGACALTIKSVRVRAGQSTRMPLARVHRHAFGTTVAIPAALAVAALMIGAAPSDTTSVAALGLEGVLRGAFDGPRPGGWGWAGVGASRGERSVVDHGHTAGDVVDSRAADLRGGAGLGVADGQRHRSRVVDPDEGGARVPDVGGARNGDRVRLAGYPVGTYPRGEAPRFCRRCDLQSGAYRRVMRT